MAYSVNFSKQAIKELDKIHEPFYSRIKKAISDLSDNPRPNGCKKLKGRDGYRIRIGSFRVIYDIFDTVLVVSIITLGDRKDIYE
jgi:mRNA interferase RelE/StbE